MTDLSKPINPLMARRADAREVDAIGSDHWRQRLQDHCDHLNAISKGRDGWHVIGAPGSRTIAKRNERNEPRA